MFLSFNTMTILAEPSPTTTSASHLPRLALFGGDPAITRPIRDILKWPIVTEEDEAAVLGVLREGKMSGWDISIQFEKEFADWLGVQYAVAHNNGTASLQAAMFAVGVGRGDEIICPTQTYWASCLQAFSLGATVVFADVEEDSFCLDPKDIERRITSHTKAIVAVHYLGHPCDMDAIMALAVKHNLKVIEDVSHAQGGIYKGRKLGSIGHVAGISLMTGKSFAIGEGGILTTNDQEVYERAIAWGHYERFGGQGLNTRDAKFASKDLQPFYGLPLGGNKYRMHQMSSAVGRVQLQHYDKRVEKIRIAHQYFWSLLEDVPGLHPHRTTDPESNMAAHYEARAHYHPEEVGGLSLTRLVEAMKAEGYEDCVPGLLRPLHTHPVFNTADVYQDGKPTRIAFSDRDLREKPEEFPISSRLNGRAVTIPWFKHFWPEYIEEYALAFRKVLLQADLLLEGDPGNEPINSNQGAINMSAKSHSKK